MIERTDEVSKLTAKQIENWLPEKLREDFDGSVDSLYKIVEDQLKMYIPSAGASNSNDDDDDDDDDDDNEEEYRGRKNLVSYDDDEDEEEDERPKKSKSLKSGRTENSAKKSVKGLFKGKKKKSSDYDDEDILSDGDVPF